MTTVATDNTVSQSLLDSVNGQRNTTKSDAEATQDRFLKLLVEQMKNQDPLNPMDNAQVTSQMAQLSTVTGIDKLNTTMADMISNVQAGQSYQAANMIGRSVFVNGNEIQNNGEKNYFGVNLDTNVDQLNINVKNASGVVVKTFEINSPKAGIYPVEWDGVQDDGDPAANGQYSFEATTKIGDITSAATPLMFASVESVSTTNSGVKLNLSNQSSVNTADVKQIF